MSGFTPAQIVGGSLAAGGAASKILVVGVADYKVSTDPGAQLVTYALGSCLGITFHDPNRKIGGLLHAMLPDSKLHRGQSVREPMFIDTGVPLILNALARAGASRRDLRCKVFGGAQLLTADQFFRIGSKNIDAFYALSRSISLDVDVWEVSGRVNRTIRLLNNSGEVLVKVPAKPDFIR